MESARRQANEGPPRRRRGASASTTRTRRRARRSRTDISKSSQARASSARAGTRRGRRFPETSRRCRGTPGAGRAACPSGPSRRRCRGSRASRTASCSCRRGLRFASRGAGVLHLRAPRRQHRRDSPIDSRAGLLDGRRLRRRAAAGLRAAAPRPRLIKWRVAQPARRPRLAPRRRAAGTRSKRRRRERPGLRGVPPRARRGDLRVAAGAGRVRRGAPGRRCCCVELVA